MGFRKGTTSQLAEKVVPAAGRRLIPSISDVGNVVRAAGRGFIPSISDAGKAVRRVGRGFIPGIRDAISTRALAPEVCFRGTSLETMPFSAACSVAP
jgi:hypothetical protein